MDPEVWSPVHGTAWYEVSDHGRVRSWIRSGRWGLRLDEPRILVPKSDTSGYPSVNVHRRVVRIHCLVAAAFLGPRPAGLEVNHRDRDKGNNKPANLEYVTPRENVRHSFSTGRATAKGSQNGRAKITEADARRILTDPRTARQVGSAFGLSHYTVRDIRAGRLWSHLTRGAA